MTTYTETNADRCECCGITTTVTYRLDVDANAADACYFCAAEYAVRTRASGRGMIDADTSPIEDVYAFVGERHAFGIDGFLADVFYPEAAYAARTARA